jgi:3-dehydroquinate synthase class II
MLEKNKKLINDRKKQEGEKVLYEIYNNTTNILCMKTTEEEELKKYLQIYRKEYPNNDFVVIRVTEILFVDFMKW